MGIDVAKAFIISLLSLILVGVLAMVILVQLEGTSVITVDSNTGTVTNETGAYINSTGYTLAQASATGFSSPSITEARNATDGTVIGSGNYTLSSAGVLTNATATTYDDVELDYTYTFTTQSDAQNVISNATDGLSSFFENTSTWLALLGVVIIILIIAAVVAVVNRFGGGVGVGREEPTL